MEVDQILPSKEATIFKSILVSIAWLVTFTHYISLGIS